MEKNKNRLQISDFSRWIIEERRYILSGLIVPLLPLLFGLDWDFLKPATGDDLNSFSWIYKQIFNGRYLIMNILFIFITLMVLSRNSMLLERDEEKKEALHEYVRMKFGENCTLARNTPDDLYNRIRKGIEQFYFSWLSVWAMWLLLYIVNFIFFVYRSNIFVTEEYTALSSVWAFRLECLFENTFNLINSFILLFIYLVITVSTVNIGNLANNRRRVMHAGVCIFIFVGMGCFFTDMFSMSDIIDAESYDRIQSFLRMIISLIATISLMAVLGRLNTNFLNIPQWMMFCLYLYAAVQMIYPLTYNPVHKAADYGSYVGKEKNTALVASTTGGACICFSSEKVKIEKACVNHDNRNQECNKDCQNKKCKENYKSEILRRKGAYELKNNISLFLNLYAFIGKGCLFLVLCWINRKNRFLFFLIHKANTLSESEVMLRVFNKYYEGCPDKK